MKKVVVCKSTSGFTMKYAQWIAGELKADLFERDKIKFEDLASYDMIIYGGSLHASGISGINLIRNNIDKLKGRKIIVFATGASPFKEGIEMEIMKSNFTPGMGKMIRFFYFRGGFDFNKLDFLNRIIMTLFKLKLSVKKNLTPDERGMLDAYSKPIDFTRKENIDKLIKYAGSPVNI